MTTNSFSKKIALFCCLIILGVSNIQTANAREKMGGFNGGGGNSIESLFKTRALELAQSLIELSDESKKLLGFDPDALYGSLNETGGFFVLCAANDQLAEIQKQHKMAMVFNDLPGKVYLNCSDYKLREWQQALDISVDENAIFVLHESLRIMDFAGENNYGYSKNYIAAKKNEEHVFYKKMLKFAPVFPEYSQLNCRIYFMANMDSVDVSLSYNGQDVFVKRYNYVIDQTMEERFRQSVINQDSELGKTAYKDLVRVIKKLKCEAPEQL
jgi:hypothetical protein